MAVWQWFRFLLENVPPDRQVLLLNLDETSIRFWYEPRRGLRTRVRDETRGPGFARQASRGQLRKAFTHVAIICDDATLQPQLPQIILVNQHTVTARSLKNWSPLPGCRAEIWRNKSAWINNEVFTSIVRHLGKVLRTYAADRQAILLMDAHTCHFSEEVLAEALAQDIWPCIIPASTTSVLQPLDTHVFARFKFFLRTRLHQLMITGENKDLTSEEVLDALMHSMKGVLQRNEWALTFAKTGSVQCSKSGSMYWRCWNGVRLPRFLQTSRRIHSFNTASPRDDTSPSCSCSPALCRNQNDLQNVCEPVLS